MPGTDMKIDHVAMWCRNLEAQREFYVTYFGASTNRKYVNEIKGFESYFISFDSGARLEIMRMSSIPETTDDPRKQHTGLIHFAISVGSKDKVDELTEQIRMAGHEVIDGPRTTGDGYYESVVLDPENNRIEITI
jgi:lactoylglutathione lyase